MLNGTNGTIPEQFFLFRFDKGLDNGTNTVLRLLQAYQLFRSVMLPISDDLGRI